MRNSFKPWYTNCRFVRILFFCYALTLTFTNIVMCFNVRIFYAEIICICFHYVLAACTIFIFLINKLNCFYFCFKQLHFASSRKLPSSKINLLISSETRLTENLGDCELTLLSLIQLRIMCVATVGPSCSLNPERELATFRMLCRAFRYFTTTEKCSRVD